MRRISKKISFFIGLIVLACYFQIAEASIKAVIFDCDGILVDSEGIKYEAWKRVLQSRGIDLTHEKYQVLAGLSGLSILSHLEKELRIHLDPKIINEKDDLYKEMQREGIKPIGPMLSAFQWVKEKHNAKELMLGVASSASKSEIIYNLTCLKICDDFDIILSGKEDLKHYNDPKGVNKPKPYIYMEAALRLGVKTSECLVIEDSEAGVSSAKNAGCKVIAVPNDWTIRQNFEKADLILYVPNKELIIRGIEKFLKEG